MKRVKVEKVLEEAEYYCDRHPDRECFSEVKTASWYGSTHDMTGTEFHLCDECLEELYREFKAKYNVEPKDIDI